MADLLMLQSIKHLHFLCTQFDWISCFSCVKSRFVLGVYGVNFFI